jgi:hypothetical protein
LASALLLPLCFGFFNRPSGLASENSQSQDGIDPIRGSGLRGLEPSQKRTDRTNRVRIENLTQAKEDLFDGYLFYERQEASIGDYFLNSISADIESQLLHHAACANCACHAVAIIFS